MGYNISIPHKNIMKTLKELKIELKELQKEHEFESTNFLKNNYNLKKIEEDIVELQDTINKREKYTNA
jgi:peptidoglycan hydrolase CwlO-like protein